MTSGYSVNGTVTGRIQCQTPNIVNVSRDYDESEYLWQKCRKDQCNTNFKLCDTCHERFKCWTAGRPTPIEFISPELDFKQIQLRMYQMMMRKYDEEVLSMFGVLESEQTDENGS